MKELHRKLTKSEVILNVVEILGAHLLLIGWFIFGFSYLSLPVYLIFSVIFSLIHQRTVSEWIHEAAHFNILSGKFNNDMFTHFFLGIFFLNDIKKHRQAHFHHHRQTEYLVPGDFDTEVQIVKSRAEFRQGFLMDLIGITALKMFFSREKKTDATERSFTLLCFLGVHFIIFVALAYLKRLDVYFIYYGTLVLLYPALNRIRVYTQHAQVDKHGVSSLNSHSARTVATALPGRIFISSSLMKYHYEHHLYPQIPFRRLSQLKLADQTDFNQYTKTHWEIIIKYYRGLSSR